MKSLLLLLLATVAIHAKEDRSRAYEGRSNAYEIRVWSDPDYQGEFHEFSEDIAFLSNYNFDNTISSIDVRGIWILYADPEYNAYQTSLVHWVWGLDYNSANENLHGIDNQVSSLRYAGNQEVFNEEGYNLYEGELFTKKDMYGINDIPDLTLFHQEVQSVIIIGWSSWRVCEGANYSGRCVCLEATEHESTWTAFLDVGFHRSMSDLYMNNVTSIKKGC